MYVSIVIPLFNKEYSIARCVQSILNQTHPKYEIIIINDGSTDSSLEIVNSLFAEQLKCGKIQLRSQVNSGVSAARNAGVSLCRYEHVCFIDADDEWDSSYLETIVDLINDFPEAGLYSVAHQVVRNNGKTIDKRFSKLPKDFRGILDDFFKASIRNDVVNSSTACVKRCAFTDVGGFPIGIVSGEDYFVWIMLALNNKVAFENKCLVSVHAEYDPVRNRRVNTVPYPFLYFSNNKNIKLPSSLKLYLFVIFYKHFLISLINFRIKEAGFRAYYFLRVFI